MNGRYQSVNGRYQPIFALYMHAGPKQVMVLVDLAMITASGQGDVEVQKVRCLHGATMGYAPLIYDLDPEKSTFEDFYHYCETVWKALEADPNLPQKLVRYPLPNTSAASQ